MGTGFGLLSGRKARGVAGTHRARRKGEAWGQEAPSLQDFIPLAGSGDWYWSR